MINISDNYNSNNIQGNIVRLFNLFDDGTLQLTLDMAGTAGEQIIKLGVNGDDLVFKQFDGHELFYSFMVPRYCNTQLVVKLIQRSIHRS